MGKPLRRESEVTTKKDQNKNIWQFDSN